MSSSAGTVIASATSIIVASSSALTTPAPSTTTVMAMEIGDSFRPEDIDIGKGDFFDFVSSAPVTPTTGATTPVAAAAEADRQALTLCNNNNNNNSSSGSSNNGTANGNSSVMANASLNNGHDSTNGTTSTSAIDHQQQQQQPLQGYDQFWGTDKDPNRLDAGVFEDLNRFCWNQQQQQQHQPQPHLHQPQPNQPGAQNNGAGAMSAFTSSTDGQIYTLTVLNGSEQWLKKEMPDSASLPLDLDTLLGGFPGYIKSEYSYEDSGFGTDKPDDLMMTHHHNPHLQQHLVGGHQQQQQHPHSPLPPVTVNPNSTNLGAFHDPTSNNNSNTTSSNNSSTSTNDWQMTDHNHNNTESTAESLLRSALQGKVYGKGPPIQLQNDMTMMASPTNHGKGDDELRRVLFVTDQESLGYADSTLTAPLFDDPTGSVANNPNSLVTTSNLVHGLVHSTVHHHVDDDMFLSLDNAFSDDFEKIKRIATEVQQFCTNDVNNNNSSSHVTGYSGTTLLNIDGNNNHSSPMSPTKMSNNQNSALLLNLNGSTPIKTSGKMVLGSSNGNNNCPSYLTNSPLTSASLKSNNNSSSPSIIIGGPQTISSSTVTSTNKSKKYKRMSSSSSNNSSNNNNNNSSSCSNLNLVSGGATPGSNGHHTSPCNGQRKERSLHYCSICSKGFKDKYSVNVHIRTHTGEKPFSCSLCGKSFRQKAHLAKHYQTHMAQKNNSSGGGGGSSVGGGSHSLKASKQQQQQQQQSLQQQQIASTSTIIPAGSAAPSVSLQLQQQQLIGGMGSEVGTLVTANP